MDVITELNSASKSQLWPRKFHHAGFFQLTFKYLYLTKKTEKKMEPWVRLAPQSSSRLDLGVQCSRLSRATETALLTTKNVNTYITPSHCVY